MTVIEPDREQLPTPPAPKTGVTRSQSLIAWLVLALVLVIVVVGTSPFWAPGFAPLLPWAQEQSAGNAGPAPDISRLQARLDADDATVKQQAARLSQLAADVATLKRQAERTPPLDEVQAALKDQGARLAQLEARPAAAPSPSPVPAQSPETAAAIKSLQDQIAKLSAGTEATGGEVAKLQTAIQKAVAANTARRAMLLALANLRIAIQGSGPFTAELAAAEALTGDDAAMVKRLASLDADAKSGLPTVAMLTERFDRSVAPPILRAPRSEAHVNWWQQMRARLERLVVIRRIGPGGPAPRDATEAAVATADAALGAGNLTAAVAALADLSGAAANAAAPWLAQAKRRVAAEATLAQLWQEKVAQPGDKP